jgi:hypothetical protein
VQVWPAARAQAYAEIDALSLVVVERFRDAQLDIYVRIVSTVFAQAN